MSPPRRLLVAIAGLALLTGAGTVGYVVVSDMSWLDALGMGGQYLLEMLSGTPVPAFSEYIYGDILSLVVANRLPYAILAAAAVPALYLLARQLLPNRVALLGARRNLHFVLAPPQMCPVNLDVKVTRIGQAMAVRAY